MNSLLSVVVPTHNRASFLTEAIQSILSQQTGLMEIIVVDDGSSDQTGETVESFGPPVRLIQQAHAGPAAARNRGLKDASGKYIGFLDDDDLWAPDKLQLQLPRLFEEPDADIILGHTQRMIWRDEAAGGAQFVDYLDPVKLYSLGSSLFRRSVFDRVGLFDENMRHSEDDDWFMRARSLGISMIFLPQVSQYYRFHSNNMTYNKQEKIPDLLRLLKNRLDRKRNGSVQS